MNSISFSKSAILLILAFIVRLELAQASEAVGQFEIDSKKSEVQFLIEAKCRMMPGGYTVSGVFSGIKGRIQYSSQDVSLSSIQVLVPISSIKTETQNATGCAKVMPGDDEARDKHLKTADFFDTENFPQAQFKSLRVSAQGNNDFDLKGKLNIHGISKTMTLRLRPMNQYKDAQGKNHLTFEAEGKLDRTDFGIGPTSGEITGLGSAMISVSNELELKINIDAYEVAQ
jgi:polyisoprenoid-binding protein YceI